MGNIIAAGFNAGSDDGEIESLAQDLRALAEIGAEAVEIAPTTLDLIAGGRVIAERAEALVAATDEHDFIYTVHGLVSSNFMDPATVGYQLAAAKALVEVCDRIDARVLVQHSGALRADQIHDRAQADLREHATHPAAGALDRRGAKEGRRPQL